MGEGQYGGTGLRCERIPQNDGSVTGPITGTRLELVSLGYEPSVVPLH